MKMCSRSGILALLLVGTFLWCCESSRSVVVDLQGHIPSQLSAYHFFTGNMAALQPNDGVLPFAPIATLFSDYAEKQRFVWMPAGTSAEMNADGTFNFPVGAVLIKNFYYHNKNQEKELVETRLLVNKSDGWDPLTYVWDDSQKEAYLEIIGDQKDVSFSYQGIEKQFTYVIPDKNQCRNCHERNKEVLPIGPQARNLNFTYAYADGSINQLEKWSAMGYLTGYSVERVDHQLVDWSDEENPLPDRALAYLEMNCGTCHHPEGSAYVSGLYLSTDVTEDRQLGICKGPVSAGKGSGGHQYDIMPGKPDSSILVYRMLTLDPGAMMPEIGRKLIHEEGVALIQAWIADMEGDCP